MRRITLAVAATVAGLILLLSYRTSLSGPAATPTGAPPGVVRPAAQGTSAPSAGADTGTGGQTGRVNGAVVDNGYGPVQVQIEVSAGRIVDVSTLALPGDGHSRRINSFAVPRLREEVLAAQSAQIDTVSGATATSEAYAQSLQAALDAAHLGR
jgi:uncharacterized protein with FMN-binding domain